MLRDGYECLAMVANMTTVMELTLFLCQVLFDIDRKGMIFYEIIGEKGNL